MPPIETFHRHQRAVLWPIEGRDDYGDPVVGEPVEIMVRWEDRPRDSVQQQTASVEFDATVVVDRVIAVGSQLWLGSIEFWYGTGSAEDDTGLTEVTEYNETPDLKGRNIRRVVRVRRFKNQPGEVTS